MASEQEAAKVLTAWERTWFAVMSNRKRIGLWMFGLSTLVRGSIWITNSEHVADVLKFFSEVFMLTGATTALTGATRDDVHYEIKKERTITERSGQYPVVTGDTQ